MLSWGVLGFVCIVFPGANLARVCSDAHDFCSLSQCVGIPSPHSRLNKESRMSNIAAQHDTRIEKTVSMEPARGDIQSCHAHVAPGCSEMSEVAKLRRGWVADGRNA